MPMPYWPLPFSLILICLLSPKVVSISSDVQLLKRHAERRTAAGIHVPLLRRQTLNLQRRDGLSGAIGLGDAQDV